MTAIEFSICGGRAPFRRTKRQTSGSSDNEAEENERRDEKPPEAGGLFPGDMDRGAGFEDDPLGDGKAFFDPDEVGQDFVGVLIAIVFFFLQAAEDQAVSRGSGTWVLSLRGGTGGSFLCL